MVVRPLTTLYGEKDTVELVVVLCVSLKAVCLCGVRLKKTPKKTQGVTFGKF